MRDLINRALLKRGDLLFGPQLQAIPNAVTAYTIAIAKTMGLPSDQIRMIDALMQRAGEVYQQTNESARRTKQLHEALYQLEVSYDITLETLDDLLDLNTKSQSNA